MRIRIRLGDADRKRYDVTEEWLFIDPNRLTVREAELLQDIGFEDPEHWRQGVRGRPVVVDRHFVFETDPETGEQKLDEDGLAIPKTRVDYKAVRALVWLCLRRNDHPVPWEDFDYDMYEWAWESVPEPEGKDETTTESPSQT